MRTIQSGDATAVVSISSKSSLTPLSRAAFVAVEALSELGISRPFDLRRDGFVMGEGAAALVLEDGEAARARGARILAKLRGYGATSDAFHITAPPASGEGAARAIKRALEDAGATPDDVVYVNAHGTSTPINDAAETNALKTALGERAWTVPISSTKSAIGHLLGAAGAVEAVATILALRARVIPPTLGLDEPDPELDLDYVPRVSRRLDVGDAPLVAISNSFGFGGHNAVLCLEAI
jgi:3-oxoacyl-[acyl-carrier-protein] synthase II